MASINVSEADFESIVSAALDAESSGDADLARKLDKLARRVNCALSKQSPFAIAARHSSSSTRIKMTWRDMPSVLFKPTPTQENE